jgi:hypothetical protein
MKSRGSILRDIAEVALTVDDRNAVPYKLCKVSD